MMTKRTLLQRLLWAATLTLLVGAAAASVTMRLPKGEATGDSGPNGCPVFTADVKVKELDKSLAQITFTENDQESVLRADPETVFRIPGVDAKQAGIDKLKTGAAAKIRYCGNDGKLLEVKVLRDDKS